MIEDAIRALLLELDAVTAIVATNDVSNDRCIRPDKLHETDRLPAIVIEVEEEEHQNDLSGQGGLVKATIVVSCVAETKRQSRQLAEAVRINGTDPGTGLAGYSGPAGDYEEIDCILNATKSLVAVTDDDSDEDWYVTDAVYDVWYPETV